MRVGIGYDIHRLVEERKLFLAGVEIPYIKGLLGHSDGDVVLHAVADAMLGALSLGDIGQHFPNTDQQYKGVASKVMLKKVLKLVASKNYIISNVDTVVLGEDPKIAPFREKMLDTMADILEMKKDRINIKATTNESVGSIGRGEAIAAYAVVMLEEKK
jgi:2-C-methyl-D-erythritol 2,4-cyclodiphosphate synthase